MKEISILLPSLREELVNRRILEWEQYNPNIDYEIVLVSPFDVKINGKVKWVQEHEPFNGSVAATNKALLFSEGQYVIYFSDDVCPTKDCLKIMLDFMKKQTIAPFLGAFRMNTLSGKQIGPFGAYKKLYSCYGCISKKDLTLLNNILFKSSFKYSWADIDLSLRVWELKSEVKICEDAIVIPKQENDIVYESHRKTFKEDEETFLNIWHSKLGEGFKRDEVNRKLKC